MQLSNSLIDAALNSVFNNGSRTYTIVLVFNERNRIKPKHNRFYKCASDLEVVGVSR